MSYCSHSIFFTWDHFFLVNILNQCFFITGANEMASNFNHHTQHLGFVHAYGDAKTQYGQFKKRVVKVVHSDQVKEGKYKAI